MSQRTRWAVAVGLTWLALCLPLAVTAVPPFVDYPSHLARLHLLAGGLAADDPYYQAGWSLLPNLALELLCVPLARVVSAELALRLFCALLLGLLVWGGARLNRAATGRPGPLSLLPALLAYNVVLAFGFLNFLFGLGLALLALALHIERRELPLARRLPVEAALGLALFASHVVALVVYLVAAAAHDVARRPGRGELRTRAAALAAAAAPLLLLLASPTRAEAGGISFQPASKLAKLAAVPATGQGAWDTGFALAVLALLAALLLLRLARVSRPLAATALALAVLFLLAPYRFASAENVDTRLPLPVLLVALAGLELTCAGARARAVAAAVGLLLAVRVAATTSHHARAGRALAAVRADLAAVPAGSLLFTAHEASAPSWQPADWAPPLPHAADLVLLDRPLFVASLFTNRSQQPLHRTAPFAGLDMPEPVGLVWQPHLEAYGKNLLRLLDAARRPEPAYLFFLKGPGRLLPGPHFEVLLDRPRYALLRLRD